MGRTEAGGSFLKRQNIYKKKAENWARILGFCPGVQAVFLSGSLAQGKGTKTSDIDFFIITKQNRIWTTRFFVFLVLKLSRQIATEKHHAGRICPNHFITDQHLKIRETDKYAAQLFAHNIPLFDPYHLWGLFVKANEHWIQAFGYHFKAKYDKTVSPASFIYKKQGSTKNSWLENHLKKIQIKKIKNNPDYHLPGAKIVLEDYELRFHPRPKNKTL